MKIQVVKKEKRDTKFTVRVPSSTVEKVRDLCHFTHLSQSQLIETIVSETHSDMKKAKKR